MTHEKALAILEPFYDLFRHDKRDWDKALAVLDEDWKGYYTNNEYRDREETRPFLQGLFDLVPDIDVKIIKHYVDGDTVCARCELSGTPNRAFMTPTHTGKTFSVMTIDIHRIKDGKIIELHHAEDWMTAIQQLSEDEQ